eukprot:TRINITY_DN20486_c0_g1_i1.p1 TRINITY_DN20486_c0_g1~~TRINITY_DN20486_c0_g1_i1.p1  ORF type:complete len:674 (+),score=122.22 TRINITY_DN20486_c0_g1_i1:66-2087(+)
MPSLQNLGHLLEPYLPVNVPKYVQIQNVRLGLLLLLLRAFVAGGLLVVAWQSRAWTTQVVPDGSVAFWMEMDRESYKHEQFVDMQAEFCDTSRNRGYEYQYDDAGIWSYKNISCTNVSAGDFYDKEEHEAFVPTFFEESFTTLRAAPSDHAGGCPGSCAALSGCETGEFKFDDNYNSYGECLCECTTAQSRFVTGVSSLVLAFEHSVRALLRLPLGREESSYHTSSTDLVTVVRDADTKQEFARFHGHEDVKIKVSDILQLAGITSLDQRLTETQRNRLNGTGRVEFPALRMTGFIVEVSRLYYNKLDHGHVSSDDGPVCYIELRSRLLWSSKPTTDVIQPVHVDKGEGQYRRRYYYGIRFIFTDGGSFSFNDWTLYTLFTFIATTLVYMQFPTFIVSYFAQYSLGTLSQIYTNAIFERVSIGSSIRGLVSRALTAQSAFKHLMDRQELEGGFDYDTSGGLEKSTIEKHLETLFDESFRPEEDGIKQLRRLLCESGDDFCAQLSGSSSVAHGCEAEGALSESTFVEATINSDHVSLEAVAEFFQPSRTAGRLETMFDANRGQRLSLGKSFREDVRKRKGEELSNRMPPIVSGEPQPSSGSSAPISELEKEMMMELGLVHTPSAAATIKFSESKPLKANVGASEKSELLSDVAAEPSSAGCSTQPQLLGHDSRH